MSENDDEVPGMAAAVEARIVELRLTPGDLIRRSGLTAPGWAPIRAGKRKRYQAKLKYGVAEALEWEPDAVDRMLRGEPPVPLATGATSTDAAIRALTSRVEALEEGRAEMLRLLRRAVGEDASAPGQTPPGDTAAHPELST